MTEFRAVVQTKHKCALGQLLVPGEGVNVPCDLVTDRPRQTTSPRMSALVFETLDVFTDTPCGGNPLAVVYGAEGLPDQSLQKIAREFNLSETTFVLPPTDSANTARVRIFTPTTELPFAGHPNVGTACSLHWRATAFGKPIGTDLIFEEAAGLVPITILPDGAAQMAAPMPFTVSRLGEGVQQQHAAACVGLVAADLRGEGRVAGSQISCKANAHVA